MYRRFLSIVAAAFLMPVFGQAPSSKGLQNLGNLPLSFEPNVGQTDSKVRFFARSQGMTVYFTDNEIVMSLHRRQAGADRTAPSSHAAVRMKLTNSRAPLDAIGLDPQEGVSHYFIGNDPGAWRTGVPHYGRISLTGIYDGVDLVSYGNQQKLEYDFVVAPGADPSQVQLAFEGVDSMTVNESGDLLLRTPLGDVLQKRPRVYQNSANGPVDVAASYRISRSRGVSFELARYDRKKPLIIDPVVSYSTLLAGSGVEQASGVAVDNTGAAYVTGWTYSADFPHTTNQHIGSDDAFVTKLSPAGNSVVYSTFIGGNGNDHGFAIAVDKSGAAYVAGDTDSTSNFPQSGAVQSGYGGGFWDGFVVKLTSNGLLLWSTYLGGNNDDKAYGIAVDGSGYAYVTGYTYSTNFPTTSGAFKTTNSGGMDAFVAKIGPRGAPLFYSTYLGGANEDQGRGIAVDASGSAYLTGWTYSSNFPTVSPAQTIQANANACDAFVTKLDPTGASLAYSTTLGGSDFDRAYAIAVDGTGSAYVTGNTLSAGLATSGAYRTSIAGNYDAFVTKLAPAGSTIVYTTYLGGSATETGYGIAVDSTGAAYVAGYTESSNFPVTVANPSYGGSGDAFAASLNPAGSALVYGTYLGGSGVDQANGVAVDIVGAAFVVGFTESGSFPTTSGAFQTAGPGSALDDNAFVTKISGSLTPDGAKIWGPYPGSFIQVHCCATPQLEFDWSAVTGAVSYKLDVGVTCGGTDYFSQNAGLAASELVTVNTGSVCARLTTYFDTVTVSHDFKYNVMMLPKGR